MLDSSLRHRVRVRRAVPGLAVPGLAVLGLAVLAGLGGCAGPEASDPAGSAASVTTAVAPPRTTSSATSSEPDSAPATSDTGLHTSGILAGVPGSCTLLADTDPALSTRLQDAIRDDTEDGPAVVVTTDGATVIGITTVEDGAIGESAAWQVDGDTITAINDAAAGLSDLPTDPIDSAATQAPARAMAEAQDCSWIAADAVSPDQPEPGPSMRPELLVVEPNPAEPGDELGLRFPEETPRGIAFRLDRRTGTGWEPSHWLSSDANGARYQETVPVDTPGHGIIDVGISGPGPNHVRLPDELPAGSYRVCTANAGDDFCTVVEIIP